MATKQAHSVIGVDGTSYKYHWVVGEFLVIEQDCSLIANISKIHNCHDISIGYDTIAIITQQIKREGAYEVCFSIYTKKGGLKIKEVLQSRSKAHKIFILTEHLVALVFGDKESYSCGSNFVMIYNHSEGKIQAVSIITHHPLLALYYEKARLIDNRIEIDATEGIYKPKEIVIDLKKYL